MCLGVAVVVARGLVKSMSEGEVAPEGGGVRVQVAKDCHTVPRNARPLMLSNNKLGQRVRTRLGLTVGNMGGTGTAKGFCNPFDVLWSIEARESVPCSPF